MFRACTSEIDKYKLHQICAAAALGKMIQYLVQRDLWPVPSAKYFRLSALELSQIASVIETEACKCRLVRSSPNCMFHILLQMDCEMQVDLREEAKNISAAHSEEFFAEIPTRQKMKMLERL